ncbi:MAG: DUF29 domain-containing protein [Leptolyngbya sp. SIO4C1]|nr:DUF29 domain-containing protein [Leptolyngbya sp. SIO4C1]
MEAFSQPAAHSLYETDYLQWIETTLAKLRQQKYAQVDWANLIEEIEDMGKRERRSLESNLVILLLHLLKWQYQPTLRSGSWAGSIFEHRRRIRKALQTSPSLEFYLNEVFTEAYGDALKQAAAETGLSRERFPSDCPYQLTQVMDEDFLPEL